ncbi:MAG: PspC domain-containing protein, partial [Chitinophagaceae bacterium]
MKKVININFQGRVVPIEEAAYDILKQYTESLSRFFANEEGKEEIINDIEGRIAELFAETLKKGSTCICEDDVNKIIASMGRPEDFEAEEVSVKEQLGGNNENQYQQSNSAKGAHVKTKMFRDENNKVLGGVCSGIANYFGTDITIIRILAVIFFGATFLPYLILWVVIPSSSSDVIGSVRKRLFRDPDEKIIAGVCSGLSQYFGVSVWIPRLLFVVPFLSFAFNFNNHHFFNFGDFFSFSISPGTIVFYVILWMVLPEATTTAEKLEMKGEKVDLNSIKNTIQNDMEGFGKRAQQWGEDVSKKASEFGESATQKTQQFTQEASATYKKNRGSVGDFIILIFKIFAYTIIGICVIAILIGLFAAGIALTGLLPVKGYIINDGWQNIFAWGTLILFIWLPIIAAITFIIRRLAKAKRNSNAIRYTFSGLWTVGWVCLFMLIATLFNSIKYKNNPSEETIALTNPQVNSLTVSTKAFDKYYNHSWLNIEPFANIDEDTAYVKNYSIRLVKSNTDSFKVVMVKLSNGSSKNDANIKAEKIELKIVQQDSTLKVDKGIAINKTDKFRNQHVIITIAVPVGKRIKVNSETYWNHNSRMTIGYNSFDDWDDFGNNYTSDEKSYRYDSDVEYVMTPNGLKRTSNNIKEDRSDSDRSEEINDKLQEYKE